MFLLEMKYSVWILSGSFFSWITSAHKQDTEYTQKKMFLPGVELEQVNFGILLIITINIYIARSLCMVLYLEWGKQ